MMVLHDFSVNDRRCTTTIHGICPLSDSSGTERIAWRLGGIRSIRCEYILIHIGHGVPVPLFGITNRLGPQSLDSDEDADSVANLLDANFFEHGLVTFNEIATSDVVDC